MDAFHQYDDVVNQIYDSALHPTRWPIAFDGARRLLGCDVFHAFAWDRTAKVPKVTWASVSASEGMHRSYNEYFGRIDPRRELSDALTPGQMMACNQHFGARFVSGSEFYQDFLIPNELRYLLGGTLVRTESTDLKIALLRSPGRPEFSMEDLSLADRLANHFRRAFELTLSNQSFVAALSAGDKALEYFEIAVALLDDCGSVVYVNSAGRTLMHPAGPIAVQGGRLSVTGPMSAPFDSAMRRVSRTGCIETLSLIAGDTTLYVTISCLGREEQAAYLDAARLVVVMSPASRRRWPRQQSLSTVFGLSPAEANLASQLARGGSLEDVALSRGVRFSTVRTQLLSVLAKVGVSRQQDLVRLLGRLPA